MKKPKFAFLENRSEWAMPMIVHTQEPYLIGQPYLCKSEIEEDKVREMWAERLGGAKILGYRIYILHYDILREYECPPDEMVKTVARVYREMADFFFDEKIKGRGYKFKRYKEND